MIEFAKRALAAGGRLPPEPATVLHVEPVTPGVRRMTLGGAAAGRLTAEGTPAPAAWFKLYPPNGHGRAYTLSGSDPGAATVDVDLVLHGDGNDGSVAGWARTARAGDVVYLGRLRNGRFAVLPDAGWLWLATDAAALPAAQSILRTLPADITAYVTVSVSDPAERQPLATAATLEETWLYGGAAQGVLPASGTAVLKSRPGQAWIAGESGWAKRTYAALVNAGTLEADRVSAKGYWKVGESGHRERARGGR